MRQSLIKQLKDNSLTRKALFVKKYEYKRITQQPMKRKIVYFALYARDVAKKSVGLVTGEFQSDEEKEKPYLVE